MRGGPSRSSALAGFGRDGFCLQRLRKRSHVAAGPPVSTPGEAGLPGWLYTETNHLRMSDGSLFHGRGASLQDTRSCNACTYQAPDVRPR